MQVNCELRIILFYSTRLPNVTFNCTGNAVLTLKSNDPIKILSIRGTNFEPAADGGSAGVSAAPTGNYSSSLSQWISQELTKSDRPDLATAKIIISGGKEERINFFPDSIEYFLTH